MGRIIETREGRKQAIVDSWRIRGAVIEAASNPQGLNGLTRISELSKELTPYPPPNDVLFPNTPFDASIKPTVDMLAANPSDETYGKIMAATTKYFGVAGHILASRKDLDGETRAKLERRALATVRKKLAEDFPSRKDCELKEPSMYQAGKAKICALTAPAMEQAGKAMEYIHTTVRPEVRGPIHEEVINNYDPIRSLTLYAQGSRGNQETGIQRELRQQLVLTHGAIAIAQIDHEKARDNLDKIQEILNARLFTPDSTEEEGIVIAHCNNTTNKVVAIDGITDGTPTNRTHIKKIPFYTRAAQFPLRDMKTGGIVGRKTTAAFVEYGTKDTSASLTKMGRRALEDIRKGGKGEFSLGSLKDYTREQIIIFGGKQDAFSVMHAVSDALIDYHPEIVDIDPDFKASDPNSAKKKEVSYKLIVQTSSGPIEIKIVPLQEFLNDELEIGVFNNETQMHQGPAHDLYGPRRTEELGSLMNPHVNHEVVTRTMRTNAKNLKARYRD